MERIAHTDAATTTGDDAFDAVAALDAIGAR
jgi:hypothetical protein